MRIRLVGCLVALAIAAAPLSGQGIISTIAGSPSCTGAGEGGPAISTCMSGGLGLIAIDKQGNLYFWMGPSIQEVNTAGIINTVAGGKFGYSGDGGPATSAALGGLQPYNGVAVDPAGNLYISDDTNHAIRMVNAATGIITTIAGNGSPGFAGDGGPASKALLYFPAGICFDSAGNLYIADEFNYRIRKINTAGIISTVAGNGNALGGAAVDGVQATATAIENPHAVTVDGAGNLYIAESNRIRKVDTSGIISTYAGVTAGTYGFSGDGGPATAAELAGPLGMAVDSYGNLFLADNQNQRLREVNAAGIISTVAGFLGPVSTPILDGIPASTAYISNPWGVVLDAAGNLYFTTGANSVRKITSGASMAASPTTLSFSYTTGAATPAGQSVSVTSLGSTLSFTAAASTVSGGNWLSVSPSSGTTPATLSVSINPAGVSSGIYQGGITVTPSGSGNQPLSFAVTLTVTGANAPVINSGGIVNALGYQNQLAPGVVFVILGSGLGPASIVIASAPNYPTTLGGTSITFTPVGGGAAINARMYYSLAGAVAGILPSSVAPGTYAVQLTYNGLVSAPQNVTVVPRSFGIATANSQGTGTAQATDGSVNGGFSLTRFTSGSVAFGGYTWTLGPAHPGDTLVFWGTGGGADLLNDTGGSSGDQTAAGNFTVNVAGTQITPSYAGTSVGYPGLWQINFTLPANITPDCFAFAQVSAGGVLSNAVIIPIAAAGESSCSAPGFSQSVLQTLDAGGDIVFAGFSFGPLAYTGGATVLMGGQFARYTAAEWLLNFSGPKFGSCIVLDETYPAGANDPAGPDSFLDAGASLPVSGPGLPANTVLGKIALANGPIYSFTPAAGELVGGGTYTLTGSGGADVGPFSVSSTLPTSFSATNLASITTIDRTQPLTITWTGAGFDEIIIVVQGDILTTTTTHGVTISCAAPASAGTFSVPAAALAYLPAVVSGSAGNVGQLEVEAVQSSGGMITAELGGQTLTPPLVAGGQVDFGAFTPFLAVEQSVSIQ
ncbi:MAG: hypothetical protein ABSH00_13545 [Bryobacteraceae bacterium]|jgi:uncharacterized protein (TIGR03437 family)